MQIKQQKTGHSTSIDAARVANEAQTKLLVISHFSARYTNPFVLLREARAKFFPAWLATELRPIYTDPAQEKGIVKQKVYIKEIDDSKGKGNSGGRSRRSDDKQKRFRKRRSSGSSGSSRGRSDRPKRPRRDDNQERRKRRSDSSSSNRDSNNSDYNNNKGTSRPPKHITPRTPFDDFDRF